MSEYPPALLNYALELATEWGENFRKPIADRLRAAYPNVTHPEIAELEDLAREAEYFIYSLAERELAGEISEASITRLAREKITWIDNEHVSRLKTIGMYYARR